MYFTDSGLLVLGESGKLPVPPSLLANIVLRLILCPIAMLVSWVPLTLLWKNGEFPACVNVVSTWLLILLVFVNAGIWHNQDFDSWWLGYGWCDFQVYTKFALQTVYTASVCAIMRRLSKQVGLTRVASLSEREKRNRLIVQLLIIFPVPLLQIVLTIFVQGQRYSIMPATGCWNANYPTPVLLVFYLLPSPLFMIAACFHAFQAYKRFREVDESSRDALHSSNNVASFRRQRARQKLYFMVLCIIVPYTPIMIIFCVFDIMAGWPWNAPSSFHYVHFAGVVPWNSITLLGNDDVTFVDMNMNWIPVVSAFITSVFFGTSIEALNMYRTYLLFLGLGHIFPRLKEPYDPDRSRYGSQSSSMGTYLSRTDSSTGQPKKRSIISAYQHLSRTRSDSRTPMAASVPDAAVPDQSTWKSSFRRLFRMNPNCEDRAGHVEELELIRHSTGSVLDASSTPSSSWSPLLVAPPPPILNPGLNWSAPPNFPALSMPAMFKRSARRGEQMATGDSAMLPTTPASFAETAATTATKSTMGSTIPLRASANKPLPLVRICQSKNSGQDQDHSSSQTRGRIFPLAPPLSLPPATATETAANRSPEVSPARVVSGARGMVQETYNGNAGDSLGGVVVSVWSDVQRQPQESPERRVWPGNGRGAPVGEATNDDLIAQGGVRVERCITSEVSM